MVRDGENGREYWKYSMVLHAYLSALHNVRAHREMDLLPVNCLHWRCRWHPAGCSHRYYHCHWRFHYDADREARVVGFGLLPWKKGDRDSANGRCEDGDGNNGTAIQNG